MDFNKYMYIFMIIYSSLIISSANSNDTELTNLIQNSFVPINKKFVSIVHNYLKQEIYDPIKMYSDNQSASKIFVFIHSLFSITAPIAELCVQPYTQPDTDISFLINRCLNIALYATTAGLSFYSLVKWNEKKEIFDASCNSLISEMINDLSTKESCENKENKNSIKAKMISLAENLFKKNNTYINRLKLGTFCASTTLSILNCFNNEVWFANLPFLLLAPYSLYNLIKENICIDKRYQQNIEKFKISLEEIYHRYKSNN